MGVGTSRVMSTRVVPPGLCAPQTIGSVENRVGEAWLLCFRLIVVLSEHEICVVFETKSKLFPAIVSRGLSNCSCSGTFVRRPFMYSCTCVRVS